MRAVSPDSSAPSALLAVMTLRVTSRAARLVEVSAALVMATAGLGGVRSSESSGGR
jgi:hypothetical protein